MTGPDDAILEQIAREKRTQIRPITVDDLGTTEYEKGLVWIGLQLSEVNRTGLQVNPLELAELRDKIDAYLAAHPAVV